jgi:arabinose-5-phosphate isomerase
MYAKFRFKLNELLSITMTKLMMDGNSSMVNYATVAKRVFEIEAQSIAGLIENLDEQFDSAISLMLSTKGKVILCGMGKSGIIGKKISATLASTGTQSFFMHPAEAYHGDLGVVDPDDVFIAISYSGETDEVLKLLPFLESNKNKVIAITGRKASTLARSAYCHLNIEVKKEACPLQLAPTSSTTAALAMGDALAVALMEARDFKPENFARFHPGGSLGRRLLSKVKDEMMVDCLPLVSPESEAKDVLSLMTKVGIGIAVVQVSDEVVGIITDGDLRRGIDLNQSRFFSLTAKDLMTPSPESIGKNTSMVDALELMEMKKVHALLVCEENKLIGILKK